MSAAFLKKGAAGAAAWNQAEAEHVARQEEMDKRVRRFYLPNGKDTKITFLDGDLNPDGILDVTVVKEHQLNLNGSFRNWFLCTNHGGDEAEPCPVCEGGDKPYVAGLFTVIDHTEWVDKQGKTHKNEVNLFVAKREALNILQKIATKREGLTGCTFDVSRAGAQSPNVGNLFELIVKNPKVKVIKAFANGLKPLVEKGTFSKQTLCLNYGEVLSYHGAKKLREMGFGTAMGAATGDGGATSAEEMGDASGIADLL